MPRGFSSKFYVHHIRSHGTEMRPKTDGKACKAIPAFPRGQSRCRGDLTLSPYAFEKPGTGAAVDSQPRRAFSAKSALRGEAKAIRRRAELADGMSEAEGTPDLPWARPGGLGVASSGPSTCSITLVMSRPRWPTDEDGRSLCRLPNESRTRRRPSFLLRYRRLRVVIR